MVADPARYARHDDPLRMEIIVFAYDIHKSERTVARILGISKTTVHYWLTVAKREVADKEGSITNG